MKTYQPPNKSILTLAGVFTLLGLVFFFSAVSTEAGIKATAIYMLIPLSLVLFLKSRHFKLEDNKLFYTRYFFYTNEIPIQDIKQIEVVRSMGSPWDLRIYWGEGQLVNERITMWGDKILIELIKDILEKNKSINVSEPYATLIAKLGTEEKVIDEIKKSEKEALAHVPWGMGGMILGMAIFFSGFYIKEAFVPQYGDWLLLVFPAGMVFAFFSMGYLITGSLKKALWFLAPWVLLFIWVALG